MAELIMTDKLLDVLALAVRVHCRLLALEGPARSSKTAEAIQAFYYRVFDSDEKRHAICGRDLDAIRDNILKADTVGLMSTHPDIEMVRDTIGGTFLKLGSPKGIKEIVLVSYSDKSSWKKILGGSLGVVFIDEVNIADPTFLRETFSRQINADNPLTIFTTNGDNPQHFIYQEYFNYCRILGDAPASIVAEVERFQKKNGAKEGYYYCHFKMSDNPVMTPEKLEAAQKIYPVGSYYYTTKILGERGVQGSLIFDEYMDQELIVNAYGVDSNGVPKYDIVRYSIGIDIGETKAYNVFALIGWTKYYRKAIVLKLESFVRVGYGHKKERLIKFLDHVVDVLKIPSARFDGILLDSAEQNFIADLNTEIYKKYRIDVVGSYKATIKARIDMLVLGFSSKRVLFHNTCMLGYNSFRNALWVEGKEGDEREDKNEEKNDVMDAIEYGMTRHMNDLAAAGGGQDERISKD